MKDVDPYKVCDDWNRITREPIRVGSQSFPSTRVVIEEMNRIQLHWQSIPQSERDSFVEAHFDYLLDRQKDMLLRSILALAEKHYIHYLSIGENDMIAHGQMGPKTWKRPKLWTMMDQTGISAGCGNGLGNDVYQYQIWAKSYLRGRHLGIWEVKTQRRVDDPISMRAGLSVIKDFAMLGKTEKQIA